MKKILSLLAFTLPLMVMAQTSIVTGQLLDKITTEPVSFYDIFFQNLDSSYKVTTDVDGQFTLQIPFGSYTTTPALYVGTSQLKKIDIDKDKTYLGELQIPAGVIMDAMQNQENIPTISLSETDLKDGGAQNVSSALSASRDPFVATASFIFSNARFRIRGYEQENFTTYMNGLPVNDLEDGGTFWGQWGGLNNVMWNRDASIGLQPTTYTYGGVGGAYSFDSRASRQRKQLQVSYASTNRNYRHRLMATYSTGMMKGDWAVSVSASRRWAEEGYVPGTFYDGYSYFLAVEKLIGAKHSIALTAFGAPVKNGRSTSAVQEMYNIAGTNYYNPNWGYQNGQKRNASVGTNHQPMIIATHEWKINNQSSLLTSAGFGFGQRGTTALDWYNSADPRPDYYRYLPSFIEDSTLQAVAEKIMRDDENARQINWAQLYEANAKSFETVDSVDGIAGNTVSGKRARYIIENRLQDNKSFNFASTYNGAFGDHINVTAGLTYQMQMNNYYKRVKDLLGADFYVDVNQFALRDFPDSFSVQQNDLDRPNRILKEGDKFGYNYSTQVHRVGTWGQATFKYNKVDFFVAADLSFTTFWREGNVRVGLFPETSFGKSEVKRFFNYAVKGGVTYKINGRNYLFANGSYATRAPFLDNSFVSIRTRNTYANDLQSEKIYSAELGYHLRSPRIKIKADLFFTQFMDQTKTMSFFNDDLRTLVNYTLTGIDTRHYGAELGIEAKVYKGFSATAVASVGRYNYISRQKATITQDNSQLIVKEETVYSKNFNVAGGPQLATSFGINYRDPKFWFFNINFNYYDWMWLDFNPARRTIAGVDLVDPSSENFSNIVNQERLKGQFTIDLFAGYSWLLNNNIKGLKHRHFLVFNAGVSNITNNKQLVTGGFEQLRFDFNEKNPNKFPARYFYGYGTTFFLSLTYRFQ